MPIQIDRKRADNLASQFDEALELVRNEFDGLDLHRQYRNAFARLLMNVERLLYAADVPARPVMVAVGAAVGTLLRAARHSRAQLAVPACRTDIETGAEPLDRPSDAVVAAAHRV